MDLRLERHGDVLVATVPGDHLDAANAEGFKKAIAPVIEAETKVVLEVGGLSFVDSSGLGAILSCLRRLSAKGGDLKLAGMTKQVRLLFELVKMHRIVEIYNDRQTAVESFS